MTHRHRFRPGRWLYDNAYQLVAFGFAVWFAACLAWYFWKESR